MGILVSHRQLPLDLPEPAVGRGTGGREGGAAGATGELGSSAAGRAERAKRPGRGGMRAGAGRKRAPWKRRPDVAHVARPSHDADVPVHVTLRARREAAFLRAETVFARVEQAFSRAQREDFRILAFSVQRDHVHLVVEAGGSRALRSGLQGLTIRVARAVNKALRRKGPVWGDRYHRRDLPRPTQVRTAMVYVLQNGRKHGVCARGELDPASSARLFFGWNARGHELRRSAQPAGLVRDPPISLPRTWLGGRGWLLRGGGPIDPLEAPRPPPRR